MKHTQFAVSPLTRAIVFGLALAPASAFAQEATPPSDEDVEKIEVTGSLGSLPGQDVEAVFGFGKSILETPRSASTISDEQMERFNVSDIDELVAFAPGTFTQSFFGVAGSLDIRGNPGEAYFRGVKRLDNPGNYPTPIGASSRIDIVRGPASPIYGPAKIGGYLNFNPKSAAVGRGKYIDEPTGAMSYTMGSWDKSVLTAEVGGPATLAGKDMGYYLYGEIENSDSYYDNTQTDQTIVQAAFDVDVSDNINVQFGGMYHDYAGNQVAGWNRLTQDLIDNGTYITGTAKNIDTDGDGSISHQEYDAVEGLINPFIFPSPAGMTAADFDDLMQLDNPGTAQLSGNQVLVAADDRLENEVTTLYFDVIYYSDANWEVKNQLFYEAYENINENAYGFSQFHDSWVVEDKLVFSADYEFDSLYAQVQVSPSLRYTDFEHGDDFHHEFFDRRDLTMPSTALDRRLLSTRTDSDYTDYYIGNYLDLGFAVMTDLTWDWGLNVVLGARYDSVDLESRIPVDKLLFGNGSNSFISLSEDGQSILGFGGEGDVTAPVQASNTLDGTSWNASISYKTPFGLIPYVTVADQTTLVAGQGAEIWTSNIASGAAMDTSELVEYGVKGSFLEDTLYFALSIYEQERTDLNSQMVITNNTTKTEGTEFELRWVVNESLVVTAGYSNTEVTNITALDNGFQFGFLGAEDFPDLEDPSAIYGGLPIGNFAVGAGSSNPGAIKAGVPENIYSLTATYDFQNGFASSVSVIDADSTKSGFSGAVTLPAYTLVNAGISYQSENFDVNLTVKNLTDERYFRANFPDLFGGQIVLPELPRHFNIKFGYKF
ncbi:TonB-dependent siderophore receptor [Alteromonas confluentis]|uniref:TonB-dependent receptor n=1 Tax=Alteromonas confluentis TaxID=1656094 RepID=A0A1E7ZFT1_9ALTE|nr:TonB-dependent receptor [Alteromonas confluentis]OFC72385.1 TonB-dependent receptor [Alteromonas confluentis]